MVKITVIFGVMDIKTLFKAAMSVITDPELRKRVSKEEEQRRRAICEGCTKHYNKATTQCDVCGCIMYIKAKLENDPVESQQQGKITKTTCPLGKWDISNDNKILK
jgi:hypothetical protein